MAETAYIPNAAACPSCAHGTLDIHRDGHIGETVVSTYERRDHPLPREVMRRAIIATCNACEFCIEVPR